MSRPVSLTLSTLRAFRTFRLKTGSLLALLAALVLPLTVSAQTTPPYALRVLSSNFMGISGITLDTQGNVYVVDRDKQLVEEFMAVNGVVPTNPTIRTLGSGYNSPRSIAVDTAGNVFVVNYGSLVELVAVNGSVPDNPTILTVFSLQGTDQFGKITIDGLGNLEAYVSGDSGESIIQFEAVNGVIPASPVIRSLFSVSGNDLGAIASDSKGDVFFQYFNGSNTSIYELTVVNGMIPDGAAPQPILLEPDPPIFEDFTLDSSGNMFIAEVVSAETCSLVKVSAVNGTIPANPTQTTLYSAPQATFRADAIALDANDNMFIGDFFTTGTGEGVTTDELAEVSPAAVTLTPATMNFGDVTIGTVSTDQMATLTNNSTAELFFGVNVTGTNPGGFGYVDHCGNSLAVGASCTFPINCAPVIVETLTASFNVDFGTPPQFPPQSIALTCNGVSSTPAPQAALTPATADFGSVNVGSASASQSFTLANAGTAALPITSVTLTGTNAAAFKIGSSTCGPTLAASASCTIGITFNPTAAGSASASLSIVDSVGTQASSLTGTGVSSTAPTAPAAALTPGSADFGSVTVGSSSAGKTFTLANAGTATLPITSVALTGANAAAFTLGSNGCGSTLAAGASCAISISFKPGAAGSDAASLTVVDSVGTQTAALTGTAAAAVVPDFALAATPASQSAAAGGTADYTVSVTPSGGFNSAVTLAATGLPPGATVTFTPSSVTPGSGAASSTMAIHVASLTTVGAMKTWRFAAPALAAVFLFIPLRRVRRWRALLFSTTLLVMSGCGGGFGYRTPPATATTYTVTVTGTSGSLTHSTTVQITVQAAALAAQE